MVVIINNCEIRSTGIQNSEAIKQAEPDQTESLTAETAVLCFGCIPGSQKGKMKISQAQITLDKEGNPVGLNCKSAGNRWITPSRTSDAKHYFRGSLISPETSMCKTRSGVDPTCSIFEELEAASAAILAKVRDNLKQV